MSVIVVRLGPVRMSKRVRVGIVWCSSLPIRKEVLPQVQMESTKSWGAISPKREIARGVVVDKTVGKTEPLW